MTKGGVKGKVGHSSKICRNNTYCGSDKGVVLAHLAQATTSPPTPLFALPKPPPVYCCQSKHIFTRDVASTSTGAGAIEQFTERFFDVRRRLRQQAQVVRSDEAYIVCYTQPWYKASGLGLPAV